MGPDSGISGGHGTTIASIASPPGVGALSILRVSGPDAWAVAQRVTGNRPQQPKPRHAHYCRVLDEQGRTIDDGLMTFFEAAHSHTGEPVVEFTGHGGILVGREVLARFLACGAVHAAPGEFSRRAFLNVKLDLTQAEGVMDLIAAQTRLAMRAARAQLDGALGRETSVARDRLLETLAHLEAWIDFPEEDIDPQSGEMLRAGLQQIVDQVDRLLATADQGRILREGVRTVIFGEPNVGKSSLLNRLLGFERAIVSDLAGTTRDTIEEVINLHGMPLRLVDTAGLRESEDAVEVAGIERTVRQVEGADLLLEVHDASRDAPSSVQAPASDAVHLRILNKSDLGEHPTWADVAAVRISCVDGAGFEALSTAIQEALKNAAHLDWGEQAVAINVRHQSSLQNARKHMLVASELLGQSTLDPALAAIELREALDALGEIPGRVDTEDLLGVIFSRFCIGK
ncbi:MAG: tRNA uridine-5-carboxymethylaminomethyl(34) synthesis GTPase MnmE [Luteolibacter sp.]